MADQIATGAAGEVYKDVKTCVSWIHGKYDYAKDPERYYNMLSERAEMLYKRRNDIVAETNRDQRMQPTGECEAWILRVNNAEEEVRKLVTKYENAAKRNWKLLRLWSCSNLSKRMVEKSEELYGLWEQGRIFETRTVVERLPEPVRIIHAPRTEDKPSLHGVVEGIIGLLGDQNVRRVGLWGMVGTGKTTIMQNVNNNGTIGKMFDIVIWVTVSKDWSIEKLQGAIAQRLKLNMDGITNTADTSWRISKELENRKYLLLLDDVWDVLDLDVLGVHDSHLDGKVVLATRLREICYHMEAQQINVKRVSNADAWKIFLEKVGPNINLPGIVPIAQLVVNECAGLPLLIDRVARSFRTKDDIHLWRDGLRSLRRWPSIKIQGMDEVLEFLKFCYEDLKGEEEKACFLYSALYPEDCEIYIDYLLECWRAEGFIHDTNGFRDARDKGHTILRDLIDVSLLEKSEKIKNIRMNKVLRDMALRISSQIEDSKFLVRAREGLRELPNEEEWKLADRISLMDNKLCRLPEAPGCKSLSTLLLQRNSDLTIIPDAFFESMQSLRVLDLHRTGITSLPASLSNLTCLRALYLNSCKYLRDLPLDVETLQDLEVLDIRGTGINYLPVQIRSLIGLRCLRISLSKFGPGQSSSMNINDKVISYLSLLEELSIDVDPDNQWWDQVVLAITEEVATLTTLTSLSFCFPRVDSLNIFITRSPFWKDNGFKFQFSVGYHDSTQCEILNYFEYQIYKCLKIANGEGVDHAISEVLAETYAFELIGHKGVSKLSDFGIESLNTVRGCLIERCNEMETIINSNTITTGVLECLEKMYIKNAPELESIWEGPVHSGSLALLTTLTLYKCPKLMKIFSNGMIQQLSILQHLRVEECLEIEEIIMESENRGLDRSALPRLKTMELLDLPKLRSIWVDDSLEWPSLERMKIFMCNSLTKLPFNNNNAVKLRSIEGQPSWWRALVWQEVAIEKRFGLICAIS